MQLKYRGIAYSINPQTVDSESIVLPTVPAATAKIMATHRLIYRGATYEKQVYEPQPQLVPEVDAPTVILMYRGQTYQRQLSAPRAYQQPRALNWRWQWHSQA